MRLPCWPYSQTRVTIHNYLLQVTRWSWSWTSGQEGRSRPHPCPPPWSKWTLGRRQRAASPSWWLQLWVLAITGHRTGHYKVSKLPKKDINFLFSILYVSNACPKIKLWYKSLYFLLKIPDMVTKNLSTDADSSSDTKTILICKAKLSISCHYFSPRISKI